MAHYVTYKLEARFIAKVEDDFSDKDIENIKKKAEEIYFDANFGEATDIEGEPIMIENENGDYIWEK